MSEIDRRRTETGSSPVIPRNLVAAARAVAADEAMAPGRFCRSRRSIRRRIVTRIALLVAAVAMAGLAPRPSFADNLLEIDVDSKGEILEVRDGQGRPLEARPVDELEDRIAQLKLDLVSTRTLPFSAIQGQIEGNVAWCCKIGGVWRPCADGDLESTVLISRDGEVIEDPGVDESVIGQVQSFLLKSHNLAVVEQGGSRFGMVISGDGTWYGPKELTSPPK
jgi:hypothetical protein